ncbi:MAG: magnesium transporter CorA family protein [Rectinema sp.]
MITYRSTEGGRIIATKAPGKNCWIDIRNPDRDELDMLERDYKVNPEHLVDILDVDEQSRSEKEDNYTLIICRLPVFNAGQEVPYFTVPCGILFYPDRIVTICGTENEVLDEMAGGRVKNLDTINRSAFVLHLFGRAAIVYLRYLKDINRRTTAIERELEGSIKNHELSQLLYMSKSLVYFTTSIKSNEILIEKFPTSRFLKLGEEEAELLEDVMTDNKQAIEMSGIYSDILSGMMDAFASVISNNLNIVMKRLNVITIVLMIPTFVVSIFGMNVPLPLVDNLNALPIILGIGGGTSLLGAFLLRDKPKRRNRPQWRRIKEPRKQAGVATLAVHGTVMARKP